MHQMAGMIGLREIVGLVFLLFMILAALPVIMFMRASRRASATSGWAAANGRVLSSQVASRQTLNSRGAPVTAYEPQVVYQYHIGGQAYEAGRVSFDVAAGAGSENWAKGIVARYPAGSAVMVFYNPARPDEAVIEQDRGGSGNGLLVLILVGVEVLLAGAAFYVMSLVP
jgi:hypothetical protein